MLWALGPLASAGQGPQASRPSEASAELHHYPPVRIEAHYMSRKVMGLTLRVLMGIEHSRTGPPRFRRRPGELRAAV